MYKIRGSNGNNLIIEVYQESPNKVIEKSVNIVDEFNDYRKVSDSHYLDTSNNTIVILNIFRTCTVIDNVVYRKATQFEFDRWQYDKKIGFNGLEDQDKLCDNALVYKYLMDIN